MDCWRPSASHTVLREKAKIFKKIRQFFETRGVLEVETPLLSQSTVTDPNLDSFMTTYRTADGKKRPLYLQTSPEFAMKRLLAAGIGPIYQITRAFRNTGEDGRWHNPEFSMLEWYRPGFSLNELMKEVSALLFEILGTVPVQYMSYATLFQTYAHIDPHHTTHPKLVDTLNTLGIHTTLDESAENRDTFLQLITDHLICQCIDPNIIFFLYDFPIAQAALSRIRLGNPPVAERVEVYYKHIELGNGFYELTDPTEQRKRLQKDSEVRRRNNLTRIPWDKNFLAALDAGLPDCAGIAIGLDRLIALATNGQSIKEAMAFPMDRA